MRKRQGKAVEFSERLSILAPAMPDPVIQGTGDINWVCAHCDHLLADHMLPGQLAKYRYQMLLLGDAQRDHEHPRAARLDTTRSKLRHYPDSTAGCDRRSALSKLTRELGRATRKNRSCPAAIQTDPLPGLPARAEGHISRP